MTLEEILEAARAGCCKFGRRGKGGEGGDELDYDLWSEVHWHVGTETGDARVGELSCVGAIWLESDIGKGHDQVSPLDGHRVAGRNGGVGKRSIAM